MLPWWAWWASAAGASKNKIIGLGPRVCHVWRLHPPAAASERPLLLSFTSSVSRYLLPSTLLRLCTRRTSRDMASRRLATGHSNNRAHTQISFNSGEGAQEHRMCADPRGTAAAARRPVVPRHSVFNVTV
eukprot:scaffold5082_cov106-Isochrysis_galbana.AAC.5